MSMYKEIMDAQKRRIKEQYIKNGGKKVYDYKISKGENYEQNSQNNKI